MTRSGRVIGVCATVQVSRGVGRYHGFALRASNRSGGEIGWHVDTFGLADASGSQLQCRDGRMAAATNAMWKPDTRAARTEPGVTGRWRRLVVRLAARVERIANPIDPPTCCAVLSRPDARPASSRLQKLGVLSNLGAALEQPVS